jgi:hypothetical protein
LNKAVPVGLKLEKYSALKRHINPLNAS